jgi:hypothetical protein
MYPLKMSTKFIMIGAIVLSPLGSSQVAAASLSEDRPAINPDFAPDEDCLYDSSLSKCTPIEIRKGHVIQIMIENMTKQECYPNDEGCEWPNYIMLEREDGSMTCEVDRST